MNEKVRDIIVDLADLELEELRELISILIQIHDSYVSSMMPVDGKYDA